MSYLSGIPLIIDGNIIEELDDAASHDLFETPDTINPILDKSDSNTSTEKPDHVAPQVLLETSDVINNISEKIDSTTSEMVVVAENQSDNVNMEFYFTDKGLTKKKELEILEKNLHDKEIIENENVKQKISNSSLTEIFKTLPKDSDYEPSGTSQNNISSNNPNFSEQDKSNSTNQKGTATKTSSDHTISNNEPTSSKQNKTINSSGAEELEGLDFEQLKVLPAVPQVKGTARIRKKHFCKFCMTDQTHLKLHLKRKHSNEIEVKEMINASGSKKGSRSPMKKLLHSGDHKFNTKKKWNTGILRVARAPKSKSEHTGSSYAPCPKCRGMFVTADYRAHVRTCTGLSGQHCRNLISLGRKIMPYCSKNASPYLRENILARMRNDKIVRAIKYDELIIEYGNEICSHLREQQHKTNICTQLRRLGRLKLKLNVKNLVDALITSRSLDVLAAIEALASSSEDDGNGQTLAYPTVAQNLATLVKQVAHTQKLMYVRKHDLDSANRMQNFIELFANDYKLRLSRMAAESHGIKRRQRNTELPSADDISTLMYHLKSVMQENYNILINGLNEDAYFMLQKACLSTLQVWNRKRPGDVERILVNDFKHLKEMSNSQIKEFDNLSNNLKDLSQEFSLLYTRGKLGNDIKLLVSADVKLRVNLLLEHRDNDQLKISPKNPYLFALSQTPIYAIRHPSAYSVLSTFSKECGAEKPYLLRATRMRKQLATACIRLNLNDMELSDLAGYMGHHVNIHKSHYRQNIVDRDIPLFLKFINTALTSDVSELICTELDTTAGNEKSVIEEEIEEEAAEQEIDEASKSIDYEKKPKNQKAKSLRFNAPVIELPKKVVKEVKKKVKWSKLECDTVYKTFEDFIVGNSTNAPTIPQCKALKEKHSELFQDRFVNPASIKAWVFAQRKRCGNQ